LTVEDFGDAAMTDVKDLNLIATQFFNNICKQNGRGDFCFKYVDLKGVMDKNWPNRRVDIEDVEQLKYNVTQTAFQPSLILSQDYCNSLPADGSFRFSKSTQTSSTCAWSVSKGLSFSEGITATVGIPNLAGFSFSENFQMQFNETRSQTVTHTDSWSIDSTVPVPAHTYVNATYIVTEQDFECSWTADITIKGCVNVWFQDKVNSHWEWWY
jgi:hypothetical protein